MHVDDADVEALTIRVGAVDEPDSSGGQTVTVHALTGDEARDDAATGTLLARGRSGEEVGGGSVRLWTGHQHCSESERDDNG
ncbi:hypothetical protein ACPPVO_47275 [Dactylosporangium sp. McL0621]|uniref:hypothetical protein n=1 Tax=Dactylosporangium sp. McL0621 TaxID=3415678 RepID=UPI003CFB2AA7